MLGCCFSRKGFYIAGHTDFDAGHHFNDFIRGTRGIVSWFRGLAMKWIIPFYNDWSLSWSKLYQTLSMQGEHFTTEIEHCSLLCLYFFFVAFENCSLMETPSYLVMSRKELRPRTAKLALSICRKSGNSGNESLLILYLCLWPHFLTGFCIMTS